MIDCGTLVRVELPINLTFEPACAACGRPASRIELVPDDAGGWVLRYSGPAASGEGPVDAARADLITAAFRPPHRFAAVHAAGFYDDAGFCGDCDTPYCATHWHLSATGYGRCPQGHGKSLDPHWSPE